MTKIKPLDIADDFFDQFLEEIKDDAEEIDIKTVKENYEFNKTFENKINEIISFLNTHYKKDE